MAREYSIKKSKRLPPTRNGTSTLSSDTRPPEPMAKNRLLNESEARLAFWKALTRLTYKVIEILEQEFPHKKN